MANGMVSLDLLKWAVVPCDVPRPVLLSLSSLTGRSALMPNAAFQVPEYPQLSCTITPIIHLFVRPSLTILPNSR